MQVSEIINEEPVGMLKRAGLGLKSKLGSVSAATKLDVAKDANQMKKDLKTWMDGSGIKAEDLSLDDLKSFLIQKGLPTDKVDDIFSNLRATGAGTYQTGAITNKEIDTIILKAVQQQFKSTGAGGRQSRYATSTTLSGLPTSLISSLRSLTPAQKAALRSIL